MGPKISIIVPVYNTDKYLKRCIDSILSQKHTDFELLLIDDGSTDNSSKICDDYAKKDSRIKVFHSVNRGVSSARNIGLDNARGEWISFIDSDDYVSELYLYNLLSHCDNADLIISYAEFVYSDNTCRRESYSSRIVTNDFDVLFVENDLNWHTSPWSKLFKKTLCNDLRFIEGMHIGEDLVFLYSYMLRCQVIFVSSDTDYFYYVDNQSALTKRVNLLDEELLAYNMVNISVQNLIKAKGITNPKALSKLGWIIAYYVRRVLNSIYYDGEDKSFLCRLRCMKSLDIEKYIQYNGHSSNNERIYLFLLRTRMYAIYDLLRVCVKRTKKWNIQQ